MPVRRAPEFGSRHDFTFGVGPSAGSDSGGSIGIDFPESVVAQYTFR